MMYEVVVRDTFCAAHRLEGYDGDCARLHGHTWKVEVAVKGLALDDIGMLVDFRQVKERLAKLTSKLDHECLNEVLGFNPTAENLAKWFFYGMGTLVSFARVWESEDTYASYYA